jgi:hypothetical protein
MPAQLMMKRVKLEQPHHLAVAVAVVQLVKVSRQVKQLKKMA